jgi:AraC family transcriptional regulator
MARLDWGSFFGETHRELRTPSFEYSEMVALVPDREVPEHTHDNAHFVFVVSGTYVTGARNRPGPCGAATLIFNPAGTTHRDRFHTDRGRFFTISVSPSVAAHVEARHPEAVSFDAADVAMVARKIHREFQQPGDCSSLLLEGLGLELAGRAAQWRSHPDRRAPRWLERARDSIRERCSSRPGIAEIAAEAGVHPIHLARTFRQYFACSPGEYLRRCRIERVRELLVTSDLPLAELSLEAGFSDQSQLTTAFRRATGITPAAFRRARR